MPGAVATAISIGASTALGGAALSAGFAAGFSSFALAAVGVIGTVIQTLAVSFVLGTISSALQGKPNTSGAGSGGGQAASIAKDRTVTFRQPITAHRIIYGECRVSGPLTFIESTNSNENLHQLVTVAGHQVEEIGELWVNEEKVTLDGSHRVSSGEFAGSHVTVLKGDGSSGNDAALLASLTAATTGWTANHKQLNRAKMYSKFAFDPDIFIGSLPNITALVKGRLVFDPRDSGTRYSNNPALAIYDYLTDTEVGVGELSSRINPDSFVTAANDCDEDVSVVMTRTFTTTHATELVTLSSDANGFRTGDKCRVSNSGGALPNGFVADTDYYWISITASTGNLASTKANAIAGTKVTISDDGSGTNTIKRRSIVTFTAATSDLITLSEQIKDLLTGDGVEVSSTGTLPSGPITSLTASTTYYYIRATDTTGKLATTRLNALAGTAIDITTIEAGDTHSVERTVEPRYSCNGTIETNRTPRDILTQLLTSLHGSLVYQNGQWNIYSGVYRTPTITLDESDLVAPLKIQTKVSRRELANGVKGVFISPADNYQPTDFPAVTNATYYAEDQSERLWKDADLQFTLSPSMAQRISKVQLEQIRQQITVSVVTNLTGLRLQAGDTIGLTNDRMGWSAKVFDVIEWTLTTQTDSNGNPALVCAMKLRETVSTIYDWEGGEETVTDLSPNTTLPSIRNPTLPTGLTLTSGTADLLSPTDGTIISRIKIVWTDSTDAFALGYELQYKKSADSDWIQLGSSFSAGLQLAYLSPVDDGVDYDVRIRTVNTVGLRSSTYLTESNHTVIGKTAVPEDVTNFSASQNGILITFRWDQVSDVDLGGYEVRYGPVSGFSWADALVITSVTRGTLVTNAAVPPSPSAGWRLAVKAFDTSGNESDTEDTFDLIVTNENDIINTRQYHPRWAGTFDKCHLHDVSCAIVPNTTSIASDNNYDIFDEYAEDAVSDFYFEASEYDIGFDNSVRVWADIKASIGPGESGVSSPIFEIDYKTAAGSYDGFEVFSNGQITARYIKVRAKIITGTGKGLIRLFERTIDVQERTESASGVVVAASGGSVITFTDQFSTAPSINVTPQGTGALFSVISSKSGTGFTIQVFNDSGADVGGTVDWQAIGA